MLKIKKVNNIFWTSKINSNLYNIFIKINYDMIKVESAYLISYNEIAKINTLFLFKNE